jgi:hypothetical protein
MGTADSTTPEASDPLVSRRSDHDAVHRNNAKVTGQPAGRTLVFAHGFQRSGHQASCGHPHLVHDDLVADR